MDQEKKQTTAENLTKPLGNTSNATPDKNSPLEPFRRPKCMTMSLELVERRQLRLAKESSSSTTTDPT